MKCLDEWDALHAGRKPRADASGLTVHDLCNRFMTSKENQRDAGDIIPRTFVDYLKTCRLIVDSFGKTRLLDDLASDDFEQLRKSLAKTRNPSTLGNEVQRIRVVFNYACNTGLIAAPRPSRP